MLALITLPARIYLRLCGCARPAEVLADLGDEIALRRAEGRGRLAISLWSVQQVVVVGLYELRDWRRRPRQIWPGLALTLGLRSIVRRPAVPLLAAITLGLGFGAAAAIYGTYLGFNRPLPVPEGEGVHWVRVLDDRGRSVTLDGEDLELVRGIPGGFEHIGAHRSSAASIRSRHGYPVRIGSAALSPALFELLEVAPHLGRLPDSGEEAVVLLGYETWRNHFDADPSIVGQTVRVGGAPRTVVAVMPEGYEFPFNEALWTPFRPGAETSDIELVGRLAPDADADRLATAIAARLHARRAAADTNVQPLRVDLPGFTNKRGEGGENMILATLLVLVVALVLVSCSNVSNLLLARALARVDLLAVHAAIGAGPVQVFVQMLAEALLISMAGALVGLGLAAGAIRYIQDTLSGHWGYYWMRVQFDPGVVLFVLGLAVVAGTVAGLLPATRLLRSGLSDVLRAGSSAVGSGRRGRLSVGLLNVQVAVSAIALVIAMLMGGALLRSRPSPDLRADDVFVLSLFLDGDRYEQPEARRELREAAATSVLAGSEVTELAWANVLPGLANSFERFEIEGQNRDPDSPPTGAPVVTADAAYFDMFGLRVLAGESFAAHDGSGELVAMVNSSFVATYLQGLPPLEQRLRLQSTNGSEWVRIVGVVSDLAAYRNSRTNQLARIYLPFDDVEPRTFHALFAGSERAADAMRTELTSIEPDLGLTGFFGTQEQARVRDVVDYIGRIYQTGGVLAGLGGLSTALVALIGLYGALVFEVQRRLAEIGVRKALGADQRTVLRYVTRRGLGAVAPGLAFGFLVSAGFSPLLGVFLGRMDARDPFIYSGVFLAFVAVAAAATLVPGARAARVDPVQVLRAE